MKTNLRVMLAVFSTIFLSIITVSIVFSILRDMNTDSNRIVVFNNILNKTQSVALLTASLKPSSNQSNYHQIKQMLLSLESLLKEISALDAREQALIKQLQKSHLEIVPLIDEMFLSSELIGSEDERERRDILAPQVRMKAQFISDDTSRLMDITQLRMLSSQEKASTTILSFIILLALMSSGIYFLSGMSIVRREDALRVSEKCSQDRAARLQAILDAAPVIIWSAHDRECRSTTGNREAEKFSRVPENTNMSKTGPAADQLANYRVFQNGVELKPEEMPIQQVAASGKPLLDYRFDFVFEDGTICSLIGNVVPVLDGSGESCGAIAAFMDITEHKKAQEALRASEERFRSVLENMSEGLMISNAEGKLIYQNAASLRIHGFGTEEEGQFEREELPTIWKGWDEKGRPLNLDEWPISRARHERFQNQVLRAVRTDTGREFYASYNGCPILDAAGKLSLSFITIRDITEQSQAEEALRQREEEFRALVENAPDVISLFDRNLRRIYVNSQVWENTGQDASFMMRKSLKEAGYPDSFAQPLNAALQHVFVKGREEMVELDYEAPKGHIWLQIRCAPLRNADGVVERVMTIGRDITDLKQTEELLKKAYKEAEEGRLLLNALLDNIPEGIAITGGPPDFPLEIVSRHGFEMAGKSKSHFIEYPSRYHQQEWNIFLSDGQTRPAPEQMPLYRASRFGEEVRDFEMVLITRAGKRLDLLLDAVPIRDSQGKIVRSINCWRDITGRKRIEEALRKAHDKLEIRVKERTAELALTNRALTDHAAKLERLNRELEEFAWIAAHDLQEPLRKIQTFGNRLQEMRNSLEKKARDDLDRVITSAARMSALIHAVRSYSDMTQKQHSFNLIDLSAVIEEATSELEVLIQETGARVEVSGLPALEADKTGMRQLFQNLIGNAIKYAKSDVKPFVIISCELLDGICSINVEDNGIGFDEKYLDQIFRPFKRLHGKISRYEGTGMGLAICRKIVEMHGGTITARSTPGEGSSFIVTLPLKQENGSASMT